MTCNLDDDWKFIFDTRDQNAVLAVRPISMNLELSRTEYDYCRAKFDPEVGEKIKPYTQDSHGVMNELVRVRVQCGQHLIQNFIVRPDYIKFGIDYTHIDLHDMHESLSNGLVNMQRKSASLYSIYKEVYNEANTPFLAGIKFRGIPEDQEDFLLARNGPRDNPAGVRSGEEKRARREAAERNTKLIESENAIDFQNLSPEKAITRLNQHFRLTSWINKSGYLVIGSPSIAENVHMAAPDDERVWRYKDATITHGREPIRKIVVVGSWIDEAGWGGWEETASKIASFAGGGGDSDGADVRIVGIAKRSDIDYGDVAVIQSPGAKKGGIQEIAETELRRRMAEKYSGSVEIDPNLSGEQVSNLRNVYPNDFIRLVPNDKYFHDPSYDSGSISDKPATDEICGGFIHNERYHISGVQHNLSEDGNWSITLDTGLLPNVEILTHTEYYDPYKNKFLDDDEAEEFEDSNPIQFEDYE